MESLTYAGHSLLHPWLQTKCGVWAEHDTPMQALLRGVPEARGRQVAVEVSKSNGRRQEIIQSRDDMKKVVARIEKIQVVTGWPRRGDYMNVISVLLGLVLQLVDKQAD